MHEAVTEEQVGSRIGAAPNFVAAVTSGLRPLSTFHKFVICVQGERILKSDAAEALWTREFAAAGEDAEGMRWTDAVDSRE